jgi:hypothetical protein
MYLGALTLIHDTVCTRSPIACMAKCKCDHTYLVIVIVVTAVSELLDT